MSVEQTTQLIQLILNSVLVSAVCALVLNGLTSRHTVIDERLQAFVRESGDSLENTGWQGDVMGETGRDRAFQVKRQLLQLRYRYKASRYSVLAAYYALLFSVISCFTLVLRGMLDWNWLIPVALGLFAFGVAILLLAIGLTLIDVHLSERPLLDEARKLLSFGTTDSQVRSRQRSHRSGLGDRTALPLKNRNTRRTSSLRSRQHTRFG